MEKVKTPRGAISDFVLKIVSVVVAVIIWFALSVTQYATINKTITNIPVDFTMSGTTAESKGLSALGYKDITVDVEIQGMNYEIGSYTANDLIASVNLDDVSREGVYDLDIDVRSTHSADRLTVVSVSPQTVEVEFQHISSSKFPVNVSAPNVSAADGFALKETSPSETEIEIEGADVELDKIARVSAEYSGTLSLSDDTTVPADKIVFYDAYDTVLDSSKYTVSNKRIDINFVVYKKVTATLEAQFANIPPGFDMTSLSYSLSQDNIQLITPQLDRLPYETISLSPISFYEISRGRTFNNDISSLLSKDEINQSGVSQVEVSFDLSDYETKTFTLSSKKIDLKNVPAGKTAVIDAEKLTDVTIIGPKDVISKLKASDITAEADLSDISAAGSVSHEVVVYSTKYDNIWNIGSHETVITVSDTANVTID